MKDSLIHDPSDTRFDGLIERADSVRRKEQHASVELQNSQEDGYKCIALNIIWSPLGEEDVALIEK